MSVEFPCAYYTEGRCTRYPVRNNEVSYCGGNEGCSGRVPSNADRIRQMTDEELAKAVYRGCATRNCPDGGWNEGMSEADEDKMCVECWLAWLKSPEEEDK